MPQLFATNPDRPPAELTRGRNAAGLLQPANVVSNSTRLANEPPPLGAWAESVESRPSVRAGQTSRKPATTVLDMMVSAADAADRESPDRLATGQEITAAAQNTAEGCDRRFHACRRLLAVCAQQSIVNQPHIWPLLATNEAWNGAVRSTRKLLVTIGRAVIAARGE